MSILSKFQVDVGTWARKTFPTSTRDSWCKHLTKEVLELSASHKPSEAADCLILLLGHAHINGYDLMEEAEKKMLINRARKWQKPDKDGVVLHAEDHHDAAEQCCEYFILGGMCGRPATHVGINTGNKYCTSHSEVVGERFEIEKVRPL